MKYLEKFITDADKKWALEKALEEKQIAAEKAEFAANKQLHEKFAADLAEELNLIFESHDLHIRIVDGSVRALRSYDFLEFEFRDINLIEHNEAGYFIDVRLNDPDFEERLASIYKLARAHATLRPTKLTTEA